MTALVNIETVVITTIVIGLGLSDVEGCSQHCRSRHQDLLVFSPSLTHFHAPPKGLFVSLFDLCGFTEHEMQNFAIGDEQAAPVISTAPCLIQRLLVAHHPACYSQRSSIDLSRKRRQH